MRYIRKSNTVSQKNPHSAEPDIEKAFTYLKKVSGLIDDSFGHIANLYGLIYLWSGIAELRTHKREEAIEHLNCSLPHFRIALKKSPNKYEFLNHKAVALQQIYDVSGSSEAYDEFVKIYDQIYELNPDYYKAYLNHAGMIIKDVRKKLGLRNLDTFPDYGEWVNQKHSGVDYADALSKIETAIEKLETVQELKPNFINGYYKMGEAITIEIMLMEKLKNQKIKEIWK